MFKSNSDSGLKSNFFDISLPAQQLNFADSEALEARELELLGEVLCELAFLGRLAERLVLLNLSFAALSFWKVAYSCPPASLAAASTCYLYRSRWFMRRNSL